MRRLLLLIPLLSACSIGYEHDKVTSSNGVTRESTTALVQGPGGTASQKSAAGGSLVVDNQQSARDIATTGGTAYGVYQGGLTNRFTVGSNNQASSYSTYVKGVTTPTMIKNADGSTSVIFPPNVAVPPTFSTR